MAGELDITCFSFF